MSAYPYPLMALGKIALDAVNDGATAHGIATAVMRYALDSEWWGDMSESDIRDLSWAIAFAFTREED